MGNIIYIHTIYIHVMYIYHNVYISYQMYIYHVMYIFYYILKGYDFFNFISIRYKNTILQIHFKHKNH